MWTVLCTVFPTSNPSRGRTSSRPWNRSTSDSLSEGLPPVPVKLVGKICKGEFVDMAEMLRDNIEAERHRGSASESSKVSAHRRQEIPDILSWIQYFGAYVCVIANQHLEK